MNHTFIFNPVPPPPPLLESQIPSRTRKSQCTHTLVSHTVFLNSFCGSHLPHKCVDWSFTITEIKNKLTDLCGNLPLQNDFKTALCEINPPRASGRAPLAQVTTNPHGCSNSRFSRFPQRLIFGTKSGTS